MDADVIVVGAGLAGLAAAAEVADAGRRVVLVDQEREQSLGGQAFWSLRRAVPRRQPRAAPDGHQGLPRAGPARTGSAAPSSTAPRTTGRAQWAEAYVDFAAGEKRSWLREMGLRLFPVVGLGRARRRPRRRATATRCPRFHLTWGTGPGVVAPFERRVREHVADGAGHASRSGTGSTGWSSSDGAVVGVRGDGPGARARSSAGRPAAAVEVGDFELRAQAVIVTSGGIGGNHDLVRKAWPARLGTPPERMVAGVPAHVDGRMLGITEAAGARVINPDRMWHYVEGLRNWDPIWENHGIRILPGPSSLWLDADRQRGCPRRTSRASTPSARCEHLRDHRLRLLVVRADPEDHREGVRALGLRAEPRPDRQGRQAAARPGCRPGAPGPGRGVQAARRGLRRRRHADRAGRRDEPARRRAASIDAAAAARG